ncbi:MAG: tRNA uridine-5-carboxymethylaminomethyl(34) synthesis GTPase MnmE [Pyrinomonadaceae bacterium MAG19_C2-C3]|nr:tRNA uridine-5-carboxymethylaminomethyl(34) synthesis GTPase MnmE [Pyrinomonadaceae bacterium MAG19_C2-C3]
MLINDTIVAVSTPPGRGGIGVIRISGENSVSLARCLFAQTDSSLVHARASLRNLYHPREKFLIDQAVVTYFQSPQSFTGEDVVELSCHGSPVVLTCLIDELLNLGARSAEPGEFSFRAFINGKLDLSQAEAINDIIDAKTFAGMRQAARQISGELSFSLFPIKGDLLDLIVLFESSIEFVEDDLDNLESLKIQQLLSRLILSVEAFTNSYHTGKLLKNGVTVTLAGYPNVGKSSIFNSLLGSERAIVTHVPGTTRDLISETFSLDGIPVTLVDTAGIRESLDIVESLGIERTRRAFVDTDILLIVLEAGKSISDDEENLLREVAGIPHCIVINKIDVGENSREICSRFEETGNIVEVSALTNYGINKLKQAIIQQVTTDLRLSQSEVLITNARQHDLMRRSFDYLRHAQVSLTEHLGDEIVVINLQNALKCLDEMTGATTVEEMLGEIFSKFCIGK